MANQYLNKTGLTRLVSKIKTLIQDMSKEAYLVWGGKNVAGDVSPVDAAACDDTSANRLAFHPSDCIDVEYSTDGGNTWLDYGATDVHKTTLVTTSHNFYIGKKSASKATINDKLRITLTAKANQHYWQCKKILMWISTSGANDCKVLVETRHINETSFSQYGEYNIIGWGGWNSIPCSVMFSAQTNTGFVHKIRLTFTADSVSDAYNSNLSIGKLRMIAPTCHFNANGELGLNGRIYSLSADKSVTFPNKVAATSFVGATATSTSSGLMSAADKKNLDELPTTNISSTATNNGVKVSLGGTIGAPTISVETTVGDVSENNTGIVSGAEVKSYVDNNAASTATFKAQTSSSNAVNGLVPAPSTANSQKYLRGDGTWQIPVSVINNLESTSTTGALSAAQGKILNEKFGVGVYDLGAFYNYGYSTTEPSFGCLIEIGEAASATMVTLQITGFNYYKRKPINSIFVFYDWRNNSGVLEITQYGGINLGYPVGNLNVYHYDGKVYAWIKQTTDFNTLSFTLYSNKNNLSPIVTKSEMHANGVTLLTEIEPESPLTAATASSDGLMSATDKVELDTIKTWYDNIVGVDEDKVINKWDEIVSFLSGIPEGDTLDGLIEAVKTQVGDLKDDIEDGTVIAKESTTLGHETIGSTTKPIYLTSGVATPCTYTLGTSVPSDAKFTDNNTTYSFVGGTNKFTVTPSGGTAQEVSVTPSISNNVTYSGTLTSGQVAVLDGTAGKIKASGYTIAKSVPSNAVFTDTTYSGMTAAEATSGSSTTNRLISPKVLQDKIDSEISAIPVMTGATSATSGVAGFVPAPASGQQKKYLRGDGLWSNDFLYKPAYNYRNGCLVKTNIGYREIAQCQFIIKGNSYYKTVGIFTFGQFYNYVEPSQETITFGAATMCGSDFGSISVFHYNNVVYLWFSQPSTTGGGDSYMTFEVYVSTQTSQENRVVEITHSQKPTSGVTKEITITPVARLGTESIGDATQPMYLLNGIPKECTYTLQKSVPSNAVFTDTHYTAKNIVSNSASATANVAATNGNVHINLVENNTCRSGIKIVGSGATTVSSDANGNITILSSDTNTTYVAMTGATSTANGKEGLVPKPLYGSENAFLRGDGTWDNKINEFGYTGTINIGTNSSNATGWFRIARARHLRDTPSVFRVALYRGYAYAVPEAYVFDVCTSYHSYDPISITQVSGQASTVDGNKLIDKIRVTRDTSTTSSIMYFDFHVNLSKTSNPFYWYVIGNAFSYTSDEVVHNPTITSTTETHEFTTVNGFKTNGDIYEGDSALSVKYIQTTKGISTSGANKGVKVTLGGTVGSPTISVTTTTSGVTANNTGVVSGAEVKNYVDTNAATRDIFKAATTSSVAVNGLVPAPSSANSTKYLRGDGTWATPTDTNTTYTAGSGLSLSGTAFSLKTGYTTSGKNYGVKVDSNGNPYVNVPWTDTDTNTTYDVVTSSVAGLTPKIGTAAASTIGTQSTEWVLTSTSGGTPTWRKLPSNAFLNTTYSIATSTSNGLMSSAMASINDGENINLTNGGAIKFGQATSQDWTIASGEGLKILQTVGVSSTNAPSNYAVGLQVSGYYSFIFGQIAETANNFVGRTGNSYDWVYFIHSGNIGKYKAGSASSADSATNVSGASATDAAARHVWFSDSATETKRAYDDDFTYNPSTNTLTCSATQWNGYNLSVVTSKPSNPDNNTIYFVRS